MPQPQNTDAQAGQPQAAEPPATEPPATEPQAAEPPVTEPPAARSGGDPGLSPDGTSKSTPADGDSATEA